MPICEVIVQKEFLDEVSKQRIAERMTVIQLKAEKFPDNEASRNLCYLSFYEPLGGVYTGGKPADIGKIIVKIYILNESLTKEDKSEIYHDVMQVMTQELGAAATMGGQNVWCMIIPVVDDYISFAGKPVNIQLVRELIGA